MKFLEEKIKDKGQGKWSVTIEGKEWEEILKKAKNRVRTNIEIPGFRKGKAPESEVVKLLTPSKIYNEAFRISVQPAFEFARNSESKLEPMTSPEPIPFKVNEKEIIIDFVFDLKPEIKLGKYTGINSISKEKIEVTKEDLEQAINQYQQKFVMEKIRDQKETIKDGDSVTFDFKGFIDGVAFKGGEAKDHTLIIGSNQFIPGFEASMIGKGLGKTSINVKFPEDYTPELAGKDSTFELEIKEIKERILPKKDDELAKDLNIKGITTFAELETKLKSDILIQKTESIKNQFVNNVINEVIKDSEIDLPASAIKHQIQDLKKEFEEQVKRQGLTLKDYKKATGLSDADIEAEMVDDAKYRLNSYLVTSEIKIKENFVPTEKQINEKYNELATKFGVEQSYIKEILGLEQIKAEMQNELLTNFLYENNGK
ncbi:trigger factor [Williamsoniiplasma somnilux]|uniref:Trigger factor n=1 Tax=Williamsoniiplasma somnilux TaxID=215578 RepID=A0A2K8NYD4_9MOLU|nr:trigger factor [Williamsoniiplasma somnilux]ATZ18797.1 trigger factor [Williamsoniiplasma somnilux]